MIYIKRGKIMFLETVNIESGKFKRLNRIMTLPWRLDKKKIDSNHSNNLFYKCM